MTTPPPHSFNTHEPAFLDITRKEVFYLTTHSTHLVTVIWRLYITMTFVVESLVAEWLGRRLSIARGVGAVGSYPMTDILKFLILHQW